MARNLMRNMTTIKLLIDFPAEMQNVEQYPFWKISRATEKISQ